MPDMRTPHLGALHMLSLGFKVLPLLKGKKVPQVKNWQAWSKTATADTISSMSSDENFGVHPGLTGHFVVDIDNKAGKTGSETWSSLQRQYGDAPRTLTVRTPTGGFHFYFKGQVEGQNTVIGKDIDTRAMNGYVVAPGSVIDDEPYKIVDESPVADAPQWLIDLVVPKAATVLDRPAIAQVDAPTEVERAIAYLKSAPVCVDGGTAINLYQVFCTMHDYGIAVDTARDLVLEHYNSRCEPPWLMSDAEDAEHFEEKLRNAYNYAQNSLGAKTVEATTKSAVADFTGVPTPEAPEEKPPAWLSKIHPFSVEDKFPDDDFFLSIGDEGVIERGDMAVLQAKTKSGKSSAITAMTASLFVAGAEGRDFLGWRGDNEKGDYVLHFDTEQKPKDSHGLGKRALAMAGVDKPPTWFKSTNIKALTRKERRQAVEYYLNKYSTKGKVLAVFIDGIGDLCDDTNNKESSEQLGEKVVGWTQHFGCAVVTILHENPYAESQKMRGHLGTYLEMKAEAVLRLAKDEKGVFTLWAEKMRRGHIPKNQGPTWVWSKEAGRPVSTLGASEVDKLEAAAAFDSEKEKCEAFFQKMLPAVGDKQTASELNEMAVELKQEFARKGKPARFAAVVGALLGDDNPRFKIYKASGKGTSPWTFERVETAPAVLPRPDVAALLS